MLYWLILLSLSKAGLASDPDNNLAGLLRCGCSVLYDRKSCSLHRYHRDSDFLLHRG